MSMVPTSGMSVEVSVFAPALLMLTSVGRARHNRATPGSPTRHCTPTAAGTATLQSLGCGNEDEPACLVAPRPIPTEDAAFTLLSSGGESQGCARAPRVATEAKNPPSGRPTGGGVRFGLVPEPRVRRDDLGRLRARRGRVATRTPRRR